MLGRIVAWVVVMGEGVVLGGVGVFVGTWAGVWVRDVTLVR